MKPNLQTTTVWEDPDLDAHIDNEHRRLLIMATERGTTDGLSGRPGESDDLDVFIGFLRAGYSAAIAEIQRKLAPALQKTLGAGEVKEQSDRDAQDQKKIAKLRSQVEREPTPDPEQTTYYGPVIRCAIGILALLFIVVGDWKFLAASLENLGGSNLSSSLVALAISISLAVGVHALIVLIPRISKVIWRRLSWTGSLLFFIAIFWTLAYLRLHLGMYDTGNPGFFMVAFVFFNFLFLLAAWFIGTKFLVPGIYKLMEVRRHRQQHLKIQGLHSDIAAIDNEIALRGRQLRSSLTDKIKMHEHARSLEKTVNSYYRTAIGEYFRNNIENRTDSTPKCFSSPVPELDRIEYEVLSNADHHE